MKVDNIFICNSTKLETMEDQCYVHTTIEKKELLKHINNINESLHYAKR